MALLQGKLEMQSRLGSHIKAMAIAIEEENEFSSHGLFVFVQLLSRV